ncbi:polysaccharide deacetylase family protein [Limnohabitans sp.]|uniref:polysaccharide deacetylase family protein n=1 Tax=Limnohabitans sp. TaxID=1907725 RepID=UPI002FDCA984
MKPLISARAPYSAIVDRPKLQLPHNGRMWVWLIVNVEHWSIERAMPRTVLSPPMGQPLLPDLPNWAWHEYGMRVGFWRLYDALNQRGIVPTMATNGIVCESYPRIVESAMKKDWEIMGHGFVQGPMHKLENQQEAIQKTVDTIQRFSGKAPVGWESPGLTEDDHTLDCLSQSGIEYVADWVLDDQPVWLDAQPKPVLSVPYTVELNDIPMMLLQQNRSEEMLLRGIDQFERLWQESETIPRVMAISVHPYVTGVAHRIGYFEKLLDHIQSRAGVVIQTGEEISNWYRKQVPY